MPRHLEAIPCPQKQVIRKYIRDVPCPRIKSKKQKEVSCSGSERKRSCKQVEDVCSTSKRTQPVTCPSKQPVKKCVQASPKTCPGRERTSPPRSCPKCESNRIQKLESEVYQLRKEIECMKYERKEAEKAIQKAILRGARALGGRFKPTVPGSIEKLLDICNSNASSQSASSVSLCATKTVSPMIHTCHNKTRRKEEFDYCEGCTPLVGSRD